MVEEEEEVGRRKRKEDPDGRCFVVDSSSAAVVDTADVAAAVVAAAVELAAGSTEVSQVDRKSKSCSRRSSAVRRVAGAVDGVVVVEGRGKEEEDGVRPTMGCLGFDRRDASRGTRSWYEPGW